MFFFCLTTMKSISHRTRVKIKLGVGKGSLLLNRKGRGCIGDTKMVIAQLIKVKYHTGKSIKILILLWTRVNKRVDTTSQFLPVQCLQMKLCVQHLKNWEYNMCSQGPGESECLFCHSFCALQLTNTDRIRETYFRISRQVSQEKDQVCR